MEITAPESNSWSVFFRSRVSSRADTAARMSRSTTFCKSRASASSRRSTASTPNAEPPSRRLRCPTILGELKRYFRDLGWSVHVPRGAQELALKVEEGRQHLMTKTGRPPSVPDLAEYLELSIENVLDALETAGAHHTASLDSPRDDGEDESGHSRTRSVRSTAIRARRRKASRSRQPPSTWTRASSTYSCCASSTT